MFSCGQGEDPRDKMAMNENNIKMLKDLRSGAAVMEHHIKQMSGAGDLAVSLSGICSTAHVTVFDGMFGRRPLDMMKRCLASAHELQSKLCKHWTSDITVLTNAVNSFCPGWQARADDLLTHAAADLRKELMTNTNYSKITPAVEHLRAGIKLVEAPAI